MNYYEPKLTSFQGRSFKGQKLENADFSNADIKGADFTDAKLTHANFSNAQAGVQKHWTVILVIASWIISGISVILSGLASIFMMVYIVSFYKGVGIFYVIITLLLLHIILYIIAILQDLIVSLAAIIIPGGVAIVVAVIGGLITYNITPTSGFQIVSGGITFLIVFCATGIITFAGIVVGAIAVAINRAIVIAQDKVGFQFLVVNKDVIVARFGLVVTAVVVATAIISIGEQAFTIDGAEDPKVPFFTIIVILTEAPLSAYIGWRALKGDEKKAWIRSLAIAFAAFKGTSFHNANLTDANFTEATLKSTDFTKAILTRTRFYNTKMLDRVLPGETYLRDIEIRQLLVTGQGQEKNLNNQNLQGLNLSGANLINASFIGTDFYQACLRETNLTGALLVRTRFESTDLTDAILTGACIEDWVVTKTTVLKNVMCNYIFLKFVNGDKRDQMPPRDNFQPGEFTVFVKNILDTIELYHDPDIKPRVALQVIENLSKKYNTRLELVGIKRAENGITLIVKSSNLIDEEKLKEEYYDDYHQTLSLNLVDSYKILPHYEEVVEKVTDMVEDVKSRPTNHIEYLDNKGLFVGGNLSSNEVINMPNNSEYNFNNTKFGGGFAGTGGTQTGGTFYDYSSNPSLAEAATEIQQLLQQLEVTNSTTTSANKRAVVNQAIDAIENNPALKAKVIAALNASGTEALKIAINHPLAKNMMPFIEELAD